MSPSSHDESAKPQRVGDFLILSQIGRGAMGAVFRARHQHTQQTVAIKFLRPTLFTQEVLKRFHSELEALSRLRHPGICRIFEVGAATVADGVAPYIVMELVNGSTLNQYVARINPSLRQRVALLVQLCDAIDHAHHKGIIHRDLKPENILVSDQAQPKILDFGIARAIDLDLTHATHATATGTLVGTLAYMSPEQAAGEGNRVDARSDVYALGVIGYELLGGRLPYDLRNKTLKQIIDVICHQSATPLGEIAPNCRGDLESIIGKAIQKQRHDRYDSAQSFGDDLRRYVAGQPVRARRPKIASALDQVVRQTRDAVDSVAGHVRQAMHRKAESPPSPAPAPPAATDPVRFRSATWQDRMRNALAEMRHADCSMALLWFVGALHKSPGEPRVEPMIRTQITMMLQQGPRLINVDLQTVGRSALPPPDRILEISNDERGSAFQVRLIDAQSSRLLLGPLWHHAAIRETHLSPDGNVIATHCRDEVARVWSAQRLNPVSTFARHQQSVTFVAFSPAGERIATASADGRAFLLRDNFQPLAELAHGGPIRHVAFSHNGTLVATAGDDRTARIWDAACGRAVRDPIVQDQPLREVHFVREGKQIVAVHADGSARVWEISTGKAFTPALPPQTVVYRSLMREARSHGAVEYSPQRHAVEISPTFARVLASVGGGSSTADARRAAANVAYATFSFDGRLAATIDARGEALLWDVNNVVMMSASLDPDHPVTHVAFSRDNRLLAVGSSSGIVRFWSVAPDPRSIADLKLISEVLSCHLVDDALGRYPLSAADWRAAWDQAGHRHPQQFTSPL